MTSDRTTLSVKRSWHCPCEVASFDHARARPPAIGAVPECRWPHCTDGAPDDYLVQPEERGKVK